MTKKKIDPLVKEKREAISIAKELGYPKEITERIAEAHTVFEVGNILKGYRKRTD